MGKFNLDQYETVKQRKLRFYADYPDGRITVEDLSSDPLQYAKFRATLYLSGEDQEAGRPRSTGHAMELREWELSQGRNGQYASVNYTSWTENAEESAIGRALDNAGYASDPSKKPDAQPGPSREEMEKAERAQDAMMQRQNAQAAQQQRDEAEEVRSYIGGMLDKAVRNGLISQGEADGIRESAAKKTAVASLKSYANSLHRRFKKLSDDKKAAEEERMNAADGEALADERDAPDKAMQQRELPQEVF